MMLWLQTLQSFINEWATAITTLWQDDGPFQQDDFQEYLRRYRQSTRLRLTPTTEPSQMQPTSITDIYPLEAIAGFRNYAISIILLVTSVRFFHLSYITSNFSITV